ncbi:hypothetical protein M407DRAFT_8958 [Tulasnella calospora MUT 4182]|uniref:Uncharacterized protein n=1 Tax=Tulasnella calospora MUT 4182 TaxID=1051891 RepID=A0A0C3QEP2_9AGAM|nr:hypothetical protein M407DRAFT_8958 [Tulasnella calospora MUT 4182]
MRVHRALGGGFDTLPNTKDRLKRGIKGRVPEKHGNNKADLPVMRRSPKPPKKRHQGLGSISSIVSRRCDLSKAKGLDGFGGGRLVPSLWKVFVDRFGLSDGHRRYTTDGSQGDYHSRLRATTTIQIE